MDGFARPGYADTANAEQAAAPQKGHICMVSRVHTVAFNVVGLPDKAVAVRDDPAGS